MLWRGWGGTFPCRKPSPAISASSGPAHLQRYAQSPTSFRLPSWVAPSVLHTEGVTADGALKIKVPVQTWPPVFCMTLSTTHFLSRQLSFLFHKMRDCTDPVSKKGSSQLLRRLLLPPTQPFLAYSQLGVLSVLAELGPFIGSEVQGLELFSLVNEKS